MSRPTPGPEEALLDGQPRVLKAQELAELADVRQALRRARAEAERIRREAVAAREQAREAGYREGLAAGAQERAEQILQTVSGAVDLLASLETQLVELVVDAVRRILDGFDDEVLARRLVQAGLARLRPTGPVTLRAAPDTAARMARALPPDAPASRLLHVVEDGRLAEGQCVLESELGVVEIGVEAQLALLRRVLRERLLGPDGEDGP